MTVYIQNGPTTYQLRIQSTIHGKMAPWKVGKERVQSTDYEYISTKANELARCNYAVEIQSRSWYQSSFQGDRVLRGLNTAQ
jgi:hypothetical protein